MTEVTESQSWFSRLGGAFKGMLFGLILFLASFAFLFWNEGRSVQTIQSLDEFEENAISISCTTVDPTYEGRAIHIQGPAVTDETLEDADFTIAIKALAFARSVEMYQWVQIQETKTKKEIGGSETRTTVYRYEKKWSSTLIKSEKFRDFKYINPSEMPYSAKDIRPQVVKLGAFVLGSSLTKQLSNFEKFVVTEDLFQKMGSNVQKIAKIYDGGLYIGKNPHSPDIGDLRISFCYIPTPQDVSILAEQHSNTFQKYATKAGDAIEALRMGNHSLPEMIALEKRTNTLMTWLFRLGGFIAMLLGLSLLLNPIQVLGDVLPFLGNLLGGGIFIISFLLALALSLCTIGVAWIFYRPLLGIFLLVVSLFPFILAICRKSKNQKDK